MPRGSALPGVWSSAARRACPTCSWRGECVPSYRSLCRFRIEGKAALQAAWEQVFAVAARLGLARVGRVVVDTSKLRANTSSELVLEAEEFAPVQEALAQALAEAEAVDAREEAGRRAGADAYGPGLGAGADAGHRAGSTGGAGGEGALSRPAADEPAHAHSA